MRKLDGTCSVEELRGTISRHVLELGVVRSKALILSASNTAIAQTRLASTICEHLAVEEGQVIWACTSETLIVRCRVRLELIDYMLSVLRST